MCQMPLQVAIIYTSRLTFTRSLKPQLKRLRLDATVDVLQKLVEPSRTGLTASPLDICNLPETFSTAVETNLQKPIYSRLLTDTFITNVDITFLLETLIYKYYVFYIACSPDLYLKHFSIKLRCLSKKSCCEKPRILILLSQFSCLTVGWGGAVPLSSDAGATRSVLGPRPLDPGPGRCISR